EGAPLRGRRHGRIELGARAALPREPAARGEIAQPRRRHPSGYCSAPAMGGGLSQHHRAGLQHRSCPQGKPAQDLLRSAAAQWKDKLGIEAEDFDWFAQVVMDFGETQGLRLFRDIVASNGMSVRKGHSLLTNLVAAGEVPLALTVYGFLAEQAKTRG